MFKFESISKAIKAANRSLLRFGEEVPAGYWQGTNKYSEQIMKVLINYNFTVPIPYSELTLLKETGADELWVREHLKERVGGKPLNPGESYKSWPYNNFKEVGDEFKNEPGNLFSHTYMERYWPIQTDHGGQINCGIRYHYGDLQDVVNQLKSNPLTRQAYLPIFFPEDTGAVAGQRVPCTLGYHFFVWDNRLHVNYYIRSCDIYRHFKNDIYLTCALVHWVAEQLGNRYGVGNFNMFVANLHVFKNDIYNLKKRETYLKDDTI